MLTANRRFAMMCVSPLLQLVDGYWIPAPQVGRESGATECTQTYAASGLLEECRRLQVIGAVPESESKVWKASGVRDGSWKSSGSVGRNVNCDKVWSDVSCDEDGERW
jgi:hypothetical protein